MTTNNLKSNYQLVFEELLFKETLNFEELEKLVNTQISKYSFINNHLTKIKHQIENKKNFYTQLLNYLYSNFQSEIDINSFNDDKKSLLMQAIYNKSTLAINFLIQNQADVNLKGHDGWTPLHQAAVLKDTDDVIRLLLANGSIIESLNENNQTALHLASGKNRNYNVRAILQFIITKIQDNLNSSEYEKYLKIVFLKDNIGMTAFLKAISSGSFEAAREYFTIEKEYHLNDLKELNRISLVDVNDCDIYGDTALHYAFEFGHEELISIILDKGAKPITNKKGLFCYDMCDDENLKKKFYKKVQQIN